MFKKIITTILILSLIFSLCACSKSKKPDDAKPIDTPVGNQVKETLMQDINETRYTNDNLPSEYNRKDFDGDGLNNIDETKHNTNMYKADTDDDGIGDLDELEKTKTDPTKFSTRNDNISDLEWYISKSEGFEEKWSATDASGFKVYFKKPSDKMFAIKKVSTNKFDGLETITEAYQITDFSGKISLNCSQYIEEVHSQIGISILRNDKVITAEIISREQGLICFDIQENDIFVGIYIGK